MQVHYDCEIQSDDGTSVISPPEGVRIRANGLNGDGPPWVGYTRLPISQSLELGSYLLLLGDGRQLPFEVTSVESSSGVPVYNARRRTLEAGVELTLAGAGPLAQDDEAG